MNIKSLLSEFISEKKELEGIQEEIKQVQRQNRPHIQRIKKKMEDIETKILAWMKENNHPGLNYQGLSFSVKEKRTSDQKGIHRDKKLKFLDEIKRNHHLSDSAFDEIYKKLIGSQTISTKLNQLPVGKK